MEVEDQEEIGGGVKYRECLKNHAVSIGGHAVDGCGEFMAAGEEGTLESLKCAACNCHRNFHRREIDGHHFSAYYRIPPSGYVQMAAPSRPLALPSTSAAGGSASSGGKKRFRTKFSQEQKEKMLEFAEKVGWRIQRHDESEVQKFCAENGVKRHVLKVWMHNNKNTLGMKPSSSEP